MRLERLASPLAWRGRSAAYCLVVLVAAALLGKVGTTEAAVAPAALDETASASPQHWHRVLERLNGVRAAAWRRGDPQLLSRVYDPVARELQRDRHMLRRYLDRGLRVRGARLAFGPVRVVARAPRLVRLRVTDQLGSAVAVSRLGHRVRLPRDLPTRHSILLHWTRRQGWRIAAVGMVG